MTKTPGPRGLAAFLAGLLLVALPAATGHGAPEARELDTRVLLDDDGGLGYGGCVEVCNPGAPPEGIDVLALDVREAWLGDAPALVFRLLHQYEAVHDGRGFSLTLTAAGREHSFTAASDDAANYTSTFARLDGPFDVGDGHPKALDAWVPASALNVSAGDAITAITLSSTHHGEPDDIMPGTWFSNGLEVPHLPNDPGEGIPTDQPGAYTVKGPGQLLRLDAGSPVVDLADSGNRNLTLTNALAALPQSATVTLLPDAGVNATLEGADTAGRLDLNLAPTATRQFALAVAPGSASGNLSIVVASDFGGRAVATLQIVAPPSLASGTTPSPDNNSTAKADTAKETPGPAALLGGLAALGTAGGRRRRRAARPGAREA